MAMWFEQACASMSVTTNSFKKTRTYLTHKCLFEGLRKDPKCACKKPIIYY